MLRFSAREWLGSIVGEGLDFPLLLARPDGDGGPRVLLKGPASLNIFAKGVRGFSLAFQLLRGIINAEKRLLGTT
jgi:hypothetical protein